MRSLRLAPRCDDQTYTSATRINQSYLTIFSSAFMLERQPKETRLNEKRKAALDDLLDHAIKLAKGTMIMSILVANEDERIYLETRMKKRKKVSTISIRVEK
jgi:hypothetical protein